MSSFYLDRLKPEERLALIRELHETQKSHCFICEEDVDLAVHKNSIDIDHVVPLSVGGKDDPNNFALTHQSCNRSKQASNLEVARILHRFTRLQKTLQEVNRSPNLGDVLAEAKGGSSQLGFKSNGKTVTYSFAELGDNTLHTVPVYVDKLSGFTYFFALMPIEYLAHDSHINPRSISASISKLIAEFYQKRPQLHVALGWVESPQGRSSIHVFDGQHKVAAQIMLGVRSIPVRVFIDPDADTLITTNTNAGTTLKQVAFDKSVQRHLGGTLYQDRIQRFQTETGLAEDDVRFSERDLVNHFRGQSSEIKRYILDALRSSVTSDKENKLMDYIDLGGRGKERPLSYSTIERTFYSFFVCQEVLQTPLDYLLEEGKNPRDLERQQILRLMNLIAQEIYVEKFDPTLGTDKIENRLQNGTDYPHEHLRAVRMSKEEILYNWLSYVGQVAHQYFIMQGTPDPRERLFQQPFPEQVWENIRKFVRSLQALPMWVNRDLSVTVFGGKQNNSFWKTVFETGRTPQGMQVLAQPLNLIEMIR